MSKYLSEMKANKARLAVLDQNIAELEKLARMLQNVKPDRGLTAHYCDENRHAEGGHSDPTAALAMYDPIEDVSEVYAEIRKLMIERQRIIGWINIANAALSFLPEKKRIVVELRAIEGMTWEDVSFEYEIRTGHALSDKSCRSNFYSAMETIQPFFRRTEDVPQKESAS